jgi:hypothetical protein
MQVNQTSHIELIWGNNRTRKLNILQPAILRKNRTVFVNYHYNTCMIWTTDKPTHFIWHDPDARPVTQKMRDWVADVFPQIFDTSNKMLLFASIGTAPLELREQLKDLFNDQTIIHG